MPGLRSARVLCRRGTPLPLGRVDKGIDGDGEDRGCEEGTDRCRGRLDMLLLSFWSFVENGTLIGL